MNSFHPSPGDYRVSHSYNHREAIVGTERFPITVFERRLFVQPILSKPKVLSVIPPMTQLNTPTLRPLI